MITCFYSVYDNVVLVCTVQVNQQIETNHSMQDKLHGDLEHKDMALEIDRDCHEMHNDAIDIKVRPQSALYPFYTAKGPVRI
jgi:hypothetical protein